MSDSAVFSVLMLRNRAGRLRLLLLQLDPTRLCWWRRVRLVAVGKPHQVRFERAERIVHEPVAVSQPYVQRRVLRLVVWVVGQLQRVELHCGLHWPQQ